MDDLTARELEVLKLASQPNKAIAKRLVISVATVKTHFQNIFEKLETRDRIKALLRALKLKLFPIEEVDIGFWDENGNYQENIELVDFRKE